MKTSQIASHLQLAVHEPFTVIKQLVRDKIAWMFLLHVVPGQPPLLVALPMIIAPFDAAVVTHPVAVAFPVVSIRQVASILAFFDNFCGAFAQPGFRPCRIRGTLWFFDVALEIM